MVKVKWSKESLEDLKNIAKFIALDSYYYAKVFVGKIVSTVEHLEYFPHVGRKVPELDDQNVREIIYKDYRIIYQVESDFIEILTVIHGSRLLKKNNFADI